MAEHRIVDISLDDRTVVRRSPEVEHELNVAIYDILETNVFEPVGRYKGPYHLYLSIEDRRRLVFQLSDTKGKEQGRILLPLVPFRRIVRDYFQICESYYDAIKHAAPSRIEAIDMGRRGLHNDGSDLLRDRLAGRIETDHNTARRLFTLLCVLHIKKR